MILKGQAVKMAEDLEKLEAAAPMPDQDLTEQEQIQFLAISSLYPKDKILRILMNELMRMYLACAHSKVLVKTIGGVIFELHDLLKERPSYTTREQSLARVKAEGLGHLLPKEDLEG